MLHPEEPLRRFSASAPIRICDIGGWTDTWFAETGRVFNIATTPLINVTIDVYPSASWAGGVRLHPHNYAESYAPQGWRKRRWERHPLLEATLAYAQPPADLALDIHIHSDAPAGASTGTSAAVCVALLAALCAVRGKQPAPAALAAAAHAVETELLGLQSGIQDQLAAAYGGLNLIEMHAYPQATVSPLTPLKEHLEALEQRLHLLYLGRPHSSTAVHEMVIRALEDAGPHQPQLVALRRLATQAAEALMSGDWSALGEVMTRNTAAQRALHPKLISPLAEQIIQLASEHGMLGCKVNGAGGDGGSITLLSRGDAAQDARLLATIGVALPSVRVIPIRLAGHGAQVATC